MALHQASEDALAYLKKHNLQQIMNDVVNEIVRQKPDDPLKAMAQLLMAKSEALNESKTDLGPTRRNPSPGDIRGGFSIRSSKKIYENPWIHVREDQVIRADGKNGIYGVITMKNWALGVVPVFPDGTILLVGQHRYPLNEYSWEIPEGGGAIGVDPLEEIKRELREETGCTASKWIPLGPVHTSDSVVDETGYVWLAEDLVEGEMDPDGDEVLAHKRIPLQQAIKEIQTGKITDSLTVIGIYRAYHYLNSKEKKYSWPNFDLQSVIPYQSCLVINEGPVKRILNFWFGTEPQTATSFKTFWPEKYSDFDSTIKEKFESDWKMALNKHYDNWDESPESFLAKILLCSVIPRRMFKDNSNCLTADAMALTACQRMIERVLDKKLTPYQRMFAYAPLSYAEELELQQKAFHNYEALLKESPQDYQRKLEPFVRTAKDRLATIEKFGRFPHRNAKLKRESTKEEEEYLGKSQSAFFF